jgi:hypothetical protein
MTSPFKSRFSGLDEQAKNSATSGFPDMSSNRVGRP